MDTPVKHITLGKILLLSMLFENKSYCCPCCLKIKMYSLYKLIFTDFFL